MTYREEEEEEKEEDHMITHCVVFKGQSHLSRLTSAAHEKEATRFPRRLFPAINEVIKASLTTSFTISSENCLNIDIALFNCVYWSICYCPFLFHIKLSQL